MPDTKDIFARAQTLLDRLDSLLPPAPEPVAWEQQLAARWRPGPGHSQGHLEADSADRDDVRAEALRGRE